MTAPYSPALGSRWSLRCGAFALTALTIITEADAAEPEYRPVTVETSLKGLEPERAQRLQPLLEKRATEALKLQGVESDPESSTRVVFHTISVAETLDPNAAISDYGTHIEVYIDGEEVGEEITLCTRKSEAELIDCALSGLPAVMHLLPQEESTAASSTSEPATTVEEPPAVPLAPLGRLGVAGLVVGGVGLGVGITGAVFLARGTVDEPVNPGAFDRTDYSNLGIGLLATGGTVLAAGIAMTVAGIVRTKKMQRTRNTRLQLDTAPGFAGLRLTGRF